MAGLRWCGQDGTCEGRVEMVGARQCGRDGMCKGGVETVGLRLCGAGDGVGEGHLKRAVLRWWAQDSMGDGMGCKTVQGRRWHRRDGACEGRGETVGSRQHGMGDGMGDGMCKTAQGG